MSLFGNDIDYEMPSSRNCAEFVGTGELRKRLSALNIEWRGKEAAAKKGVSKVVIGLVGSGEVFLEACQSSIRAIKSGKCSSSELLGTIRIVRDDGDKHSGVSETSAKECDVVGEIRRISDTTALVVFHKEISAFDAPSCAISLFKELDLKLCRVMILDSLNVFKMYGREKDRNGARALWTSTWDCRSMGGKIQVLKPPAMLDGMSAALVAHCEMSGVAAIAYVVPRETHLFVECRSLSMFEVALEAIFDSEDDTRSKEIQKLLPGSYRSAIEKFGATGTSDSLHLYS